MKLVVTGNSECILEDPHIFDQFHVEIAGYELVDWSRTGLGYECENNEALVPVDVLVATYLQAEVVPWVTRLLGLMAHAAESGWVDPDGRIRGHVKVTSRDG